MNGPFETNRRLLLPPDGEGPTSTGPLDPRELVQALLDKWWVMVLLAGLAAAAAYRQAGTLPVIYSAKAVLQVEQEEQRLVSIQEVLQQDLRANEVLNTIVANIKNSSVLMRVVRANSLTNDPIFMPGRTNGLSEEQAMLVLNSMVNCKLRKDTRLIDITVSHGSAGLARRLANSVAHEFIRETVNQRYSTTLAANERLFEEGARLKKKLEESEKRLQAYKEQQRMLSADERQGTVAEKLTSLNKSYTEAKALRLQLEADLNRIQAVSNDVAALMTLPNVLNDPTIATLRQKVVEMEATVQTLSQRYKPKYPLMIQSQTQLDDLRNSLHKLVKAVPMTARAAHEGALAREQSLAQALEGAQKENLALANAGIQYHVLEREVESDRTLYDSVLRRLKETDLAKSLDKRAIAIVEPAGRATRQAYYPRKILMAAAAAAGIGVGAVLVLLLRLLDRSIRSVDRAEEHLGLPVVASVPLLNRAARKSLSVVSEHPDSPGAEAFRTLRAACLNSGEPASVRTVLFTSTLPGEGKSFASLNYAECLAREGRQTLLIDLDLRRPSLGDLLGVSPQAPGVREFLKRQANVSALVSSTPHPHLYILPAGSPQSDSPEWLTLEAVRTLLHEAQSQFDRIVIDSAPVNCVGDTLLILPAVDMTFLLVRAGKTPRRAVMRAIALMARVHRPPNGLILNFMPTSAGFGYYHSYYQDYYGQKRLRAPAA